MIKKQHFLRYFFIFKLGLFQYLYENVSCNFHCEPHSLDRSLARGTSNVRGRTKGRHTFFHFLVVEPLRYGSVFSLILSFNEKKSQGSGGLSPPPPPLSGSTIKNTLFNVSSLKQALGIDKVNISLNFLNIKTNWLVY